MGGSTERDLGAHYIGPTREELVAKYGEDGFITVSPSQLNVWFSCHYKWYLSYALDYTTGQSKQMKLGEMIHELQKMLYEHFLGRAVEPLGMREINRFYKKLEPRYQTYEDQILLYQGYTIFLQYCDWAGQYDDFTALAVETEVFAETGWKIKDGRVIVLHGILDLVVDRDGELGVVDHKTYGSERGKWTTDLVYFDQQLVFYMLLLHLNGVTPSFGAINGINTYPYKKAVTNDKRFNREDVYHSPERLEDYLKNIKEICQEIFGAISYPKRLTKDCSRCGYKEVCDLELRGMDSKALLEMKHRKDAPDITMDFEIDLEEVGFDA